MCVFPDAVDYLFYFSWVHVEFFEVVVEVGEVCVFAVLLAGQVSGGGLVG